MQSFQRRKDSSWELENFRTTLWTFPRFADTQANLDRLPARTNENIALNRIYLNVNIDWRTCLREDITTISFSENKSKNYYWSHELFT